MAKPKKPKVTNKTINRKGFVYTDTTLEITLGDGTEITRDIVQKAPCVVAIVYNVEDNKVVLVKEFRVGSMKEELGFVAGFIDKGENPEQAIIREVIEETGYTPSKIEFLGSTYTSSGFTDEQVFHFYVTVSGIKAEQKLDHDEHIEIVYADGDGGKDGVIALIQSGKINGNHAHATLLKYAIARKLFGANV